MLHCRQNDEAIKQMKYTFEGTSKYQVTTTTDYWLQVMYVTLDENNLDTIL